MANCRIYGMNVPCVPNRDADMRRNRKGASFAPTGLKGQLQKIERKARGRKKGGRYD